MDKIIESEIKKEEPECCPICDGVVWESLDKYRDHEYWFNTNLRFEEPVGYKICTTCGFTTYNYIKNYSEIYDKARPALNYNNHITGARKLWYHERFLSDLFKDGKINSAADIGAAQGMLLYLYRDFFKVRMVAGSEYSVVCRNYAKNCYGITLKEKLTEGKYDLISYYHVLEHIPHPDRELEKARDMLSDNGYLYVSVPVWFGRLEEASGMPCRDFENLFHVNHINTWTVNGVNNLFKKTGFEIIKSDREIYGYTMLLKKGKRQPVEHEDYKMIIKKLESTISAITLLNRKEYKKAIDIYPDFPDAYIFWAMSKDVMKDKNEQIKILDRGIEACNNYNKIIEHKAVILSQWADGYDNNAKMAEKLLRKVISIKPTESAYFLLAMIRGNLKKDYMEAIECLGVVMKINPGRWKECTNFIMNYKGEKWKSE